MTLTTTQKVRIHSQAVSAGRNPALIQGIPSWSVDNSAIARVVPDDDGIEAVVFARGTAGTFRASVFADADLGVGTRIITGSMDVQVV